MNLKIESSKGPFNVSKHTAFSGSHLQIKQWFVNVKLTFAR